MAIFKIPSIRSWIVSTPMSMIVPYIQRNLEFNIGTKVDGTFNVRSAEEVRKKGKEKKGEKPEFFTFLSL